MGGGTHEHRAVARVWSALASLAGGPLIGALQFESSSLALVLGLALFVGVPRARPRTLAMSVPL